MYNRNPFVPVPMIIEKHVKNEVKGFGFVRYKDFHQ